MFNCDVQEVARRLSQHSEHLEKQEADVTEVPEPQTPETPLYSASQVTIKMPKAPAEPLGK